MDETVLSPLKMSRSTYKALDATEKNYAPANLTGKNKADPEYHVFPEKAAAALWTTPSDLLKAVYAVQKSLKADDFLERRWARMMLTEVSDEIGYALGWVAKKGSAHFEHGGSNPPGYQCIVFGYADLPRVEGKLEGDGKEDAEVAKPVPEHCGLCVMTSSELGTEVIVRILRAIPYLKSWSYTWDNPTVPFLDRSRSIDGQAKNWCGEWGPGDWNIVEVEGGMSVRFGLLPALKLVPGVLLPHQYDEGNSIDLVADGLDLMLRLGWKDGARIVEVWQNGPAITLERKS
jgi:Beta-lactamase